MYFYMQVLQGSCVGNKQFVINKKEPTARKNGGRGLPPPPLDRPLPVCLCCIHVCVQCVHFVINLIVDFLPLV